MRYTRKIELPREEKLKGMAALLAVPGFGRATVRELIKVWERKGFTVAEAWSQQTRWKYRGFELSEQQQVALNEFRQTWTVEGYWQHLHQGGVEVLPHWQFPELLQQITDPPLLLFLKGNIGCLRPTHIAVVGSRTPTRYGQWATQRIVSQLLEKDVSIVSGFMVGIDYQSHQVAVQVGGRSVGVLGFGWGKMYPRHLSRAAEEFLAAGNLFVTEYPPGFPPSPGQFPARNRIVAGLAAATLVVEAREKSGSLITAQCALEAGRVVGAVPGPIDSVYSQGTHFLLRQGALLVESGRDVLEELKL